MALLPKAGHPRTSGFPSTTCKHNHTDFPTNMTSDQHSSLAANQQQLNDSCDTWEVARNSPEELSAIEESILDVANSTGVDSRFILAMIMQSSSGCVRAISTHSSYLASGLMQRYDTSLSPKMHPTQLQTNTN